MLSWIAGIIATAIVYVGLDACWLTLMGPRLYKPALAPLLAETVRPAPAIIFYLLYLVGLLLLAVTPGIVAQRWSVTAWRAVLLALVAYGTYDLTNQATMRVWPLPITLADLCWGAFASLCAASAGYFAARALGAH